MTLAVDEFLRRFLLHVLPPGFVRIRHFGLMAHRRRGALLLLCVQLLAESGRTPAQTRTEWRLTSAACGPRRPTPSFQATWRTVRRFSAGKAAAGSVT